METNLGNPIHKEIIWLLLSFVSLKNMEKATYIFRFNQNLCLILLQPKFVKKWLHLFMFSTVLVTQK